MPKTVEELEALKEEYKKLNDKLSELSDEELSNDAGGNTASGSTYRQLGIEFDSYSQKPDYHPIITTIFNHCNLFDVSCCGACMWSKFKGLTLYCECRSRENDPVK